jgi:hypothetical protein
MAQGASLLVLVRQPPKQAGFSAKYDYLDFFTQNHYLT